MTRDSVGIAQASAEAMWADDKATRGMGMKIERVGPGLAVLSMSVAANMVNGHGFCHGGYIFSLADSAFAFACNTHGKLTVSIDNSITYPAPIHAGDVLTAVAQEEASSGRLSYYRADVTNQRGEVVALFRGTAFKTGRDHFAGRES